MTATLVGALVTAGILGATHAIEPDHVAGISSLSGRYDDARLSALVGVCFSAGHVALVVAWLAVAYFVLGQTSFPEVLNTLGTLAITVLLAAFGVFLTVQGYRVAAGAHTRDDHGRDGKHTHQHEQGHSHQHEQGHSHQSGQGHSRQFGQSYSHQSGQGHSHDDDPRRGAVDPHFRLPLVGGHSNGHTTRAYLKTGLVGALFTLSPPLSMMAFAGTLVPTYGSGVVALAVLAYAASITLTMAAIGAGVGRVFQLLGRNGTAHGVVRVVTGVGVTGFAAVVFADTFALV